MYYRVKVLELKPENNYCLIKIKADKAIHDEILRLNQNGVFGEIRIDDGRRISSDQRKKLYATFRDIADWVGDIPEYIKELFKFNFCAETGQEYFSLSDCSITNAREFINFVIEFVIKNGIPLKELALNRADDINKYLYLCLKYKKCCICGKNGEIHHVDAIGMGNNRHDIDDSMHEKICLCRGHHTDAHSMGNTDFFKANKVYGILFVA